MGDTWIEFHEAAAETLALLIADLIEEGESAFEAFMREQGWTVQQPLPRRLRNVRFDIPFQVERTNRHQDLLATFP